MSLSRVNPADWGYGDGLSSTQLNQLDTNVSEAVHKTSAGDTVSGIIQFSGSGRILDKYAAGADADTTYSATSARNIYVAGLTADRTYTLSTTGAQNGDTITIVVASTVTKLITIAGKGTIGPIGGDWARWATFIYTGSWTFLCGDSPSKWMRTDASTTHWWKCDEASGTLASSATALTLSTLGTCIYQVGSPVGYGLDANASIFTSSAAPTIGASALTVSAWSRPSPATATSNQDIFTYWDNISDEYVRLFINTATNTTSIKFLVKGTFGIVTATRALNTSFPVNALSSWRHIAGVFNGSTAKIFLDGAEIVSAAASGTLTTNASYRMSLGYSPSSIAPGRLADVRVEGTARNQAWLTEAYQRGAGFYRKEAA